MTQELHSSIKATMVRDGSTSFELDGTFADKHIDGMNRKSCCCVRNASLTDDGAEDDSSSGPKPAFSLPFPNS